MSSTDILSGGLTSGTVSQDNRLQSVQVGYRLGHNYLMGKQQDPPGQQQHPITHGLRMGWLKKWGRFVLKWKHMKFIQLFSTNWNEAERNRSWNTGSICPRGTVHWSHSHGGRCAVVRLSAPEASDPSSDSCLLWFTSLQMAFWGLDMIWNLTVIIMYQEIYFKH